MCRHVNIELAEVSCSRCSHPWWWPESVDRKRRRDGKPLWCPYCGTLQSYPIGKTKEQKLKEQLAAVGAEAEQLAACCNNLEARVAAKDLSIRGYKGMIGRMRKRMKGSEGPSEDGPR